jgi:2,3-bisphosphoglycerate-dependent phosphoglycerate mutase
VTSEIGVGTLVLLIRHGETQWNVDQRVQGHLDVGLSERGVAQARQLARWLTDEPLHAVYTSDLQRAHATAEILAGDRAPVMDDPRLREAKFGVFEGLSSAEIEATYPEAFRAWREDAVANRPPGGETLEEMQERCMAALHEHLPKHPGQIVAVVAHGGPIRAMLCGLLDLPLRIYPKLRVENTSVARVLFTERGAILAGANDVGHLKASAAAPEHAGWEER